MIKPAFSPKGPTEKVTLTFDFSAELGSATISSAACVATTVAGTDASPSSVISGAAQISGGDVLQLVKQGLVGCDYNVTCTATLSDGRVLVLARILPVRTP